MFPSVDPSKLASMQEISKNITAKVTINYKDNTATIAMSSHDPKAAQIIPELLSQFAGGLATQLQTFFAMRGEIVEIGKSK